MKAALKIIGKIKTKPGNFSRARVEFIVASSDSKAFPICRSANRRSAGVWAADGVYKQDVALRPDMVLISRRQNSRIKLKEEKEPLNNLRFF